MSVEADGASRGSGVGSFGRVMWANVAIAVVSSALLVAVVWHLPWPRPADSGVAGAAATAMLVCSALVTFVVTILTVVQRRRWTRALAVWATVVVCALGASTVGRPDFSDYQHEFDEVAHRVLRQPESPQGHRYYHDLRIGRFDLAYVYAGGEGAVYFHDARTGLSPGHDPGWIYAPDGLSEATVERSGATPIGAGWYSFAHLVVDDY